MESSQELSMDQSFLLSLKKVVFPNLGNDQFGVEELSFEVGLSRSQVHRKLQKINGKSITQFIREIRLEEAHKLLQNKVGTASEISYRVGFSSPTYFNKCFREQYGYTPGEVKIKKSATLVGQVAIDPEFSDIEKKDFSLSGASEDFEDTGVHKHATILFSDIAGFTALMGSDESKAIELIKKNREIHSQHVKKYNGKLIKEMGDGMLASFSLASEAVRCAIDIQKASKENDIPLKIGIHEGEILFDAGDVLGDGVNVASRLQENTIAGCISISGSVYRDIKNKPEIHTAYIGEKRFKNVDEPVKVYEVFCEDGQTTPRQKKITSHQKSILYTAIGALVLLLVLSLWVFKPFSKLDKIDQKKSITILPFINNSPDPENAFMATGVMDQIRAHAQKISGINVVITNFQKDFWDRVPNFEKLGKDYNVDYFLKGSVRQVGESIRIDAVLFEASTGITLGSEPMVYDGNYSTGMLHFESAVAINIANVLNAILSEEEQSNIESIPKTNITADEIFRRARHEHLKYWDDFSQRKALQTAVRLYQSVLDHDSTYAQAYIGLAMVYYNLSSFKVNHDSLLALANKALSFDKQLDEAYLVKAMYHQLKYRNHTKAIENLNKAIRLNPNYSWDFAYRGFVNRYHGYYMDAIKDFHIAEHLEKRTTYQGTVLGWLSLAYGASGFIDEEIHFYKEHGKLNGDTSISLYKLADLEWRKGNLEESRKIYEKIYEEDTVNAWVAVQVLNLNNLLGKSEDAFHCASNIISKWGRKNWLVDRGVVGYAYWNAGELEEARSFLNAQIGFILRAIERNRESSQILDAKTLERNLASLYIFLGEKEKGYEHLEEFAQLHACPKKSVDLLKIDPFLDGIRDEQRFQQILKEIEEKYLKEHLKVEKWLSQRS